MALSITDGDLVAVTDVMKILVDDANDASVDEAARMRETLLRVAKAVKDAQDAMEARLREQLEALKEARTIDGRVYVMKDDYADTWLHDSIVSKLVDVVSRPDDDGVIPTAKEAAREAAEAVYRVFVSPSTKAKVGQLEHFLGDEGPKLRTRTRKGRKLQVVVLGEEDADE